MLSSGIMQRAFVEAIVLGLACGPLGVWILLLRRAYAAESLSHAMLPGLVIAALAGVPLIFGAAGGRARRRRIGSIARRAGGDVGVAVVVSGLFGLGGILALSPGDAAAARRAAVRRPARASPTATWSRPRCSALGVLLALAFAYRSLGRSRGFEQRGRGARRPRAARDPRRHDRRRRPGPRQPAAGRADPRARRRRAEPRARACRTILGLAAGLAVLAGRRRARRSPTSSRSPPGASIALCAVALSSLGLLKPKLGMP